MLTARENYIISHDWLFSAKTEKEILDLSRSIVENYKENRLIWAELQHFKENGIVLGKHPIFKRRERIEEIRFLSIPDLFRLQRKLEHRIICNRSEIKKAPKSKNTAERTRLIDTYTHELTEVNRLLKPE